MDESEVTTKEPGPHLDDLAVCVYQYAAVRHQFHVADAARHCGVPAGKIEDAITCLLRYRLLEPVGEDEYAAIPPGTAAVHLLGPAERELHERQRELDEKRVLLESLVPIYETSAVRRRLPGAVETIVDVDTVRGVLSELVATCQYEMLTARPDGPNGDEPLDDTLLRRGIPMRVLYRQSDRLHPSAASYVEAVADRGAQVRTVASGLMQMTAFDREHLMIPLRGKPEGAVLVRDPSCVDLAVTAFEQLWLRARPVTAGPRRAELRMLSEGTKQSLLRLLVEGATDQAAARQLGISVRTCQRHIAEIMKRLGARNRLQLGLLIEQQGLLAEGG